MAKRENLPKIVADIQDVVAQLVIDFNENHDPITDDNLALHRLCAKLEFLLSSSIKEKLIGGKKNYWHWIYSALRHNKGLNDGLRYVQANKELRTSTGKGRAMIRYCLVHQTLADSFQNCLMNESTSKQYLSPDSILSNQTHSSAFVMSLYDLNAVNFDLNSKGFDLDMGWPTFASKQPQPTPSYDNWAIRSQVGSLGSLTTASIMMETPNIQGSGSSLPSSVDHRIEDLVLELDQSDNKIKEQENLISRLEEKSDDLLKSTGEKEDILARVISDLESKNQHLQDALSLMSNEFEAREQEWQEKHSHLSIKMSEATQNNEKLTAKVSQLEGDKRNLEDLCSQQMTNLTSNFNSNVYTPVTSSVVMSSHSVTPDDQQGTDFMLDLQSDLSSLKEENKNLNSELEKLRQLNSSTQVEVSQLQCKLEEAEDETNILVEKTKSEVKEATANELVAKICAVMPAENCASKDSPLQVDEIVKQIAILIHQNKHLESLHTVSNDESPSVEALKSENEDLKIDHSSALEELENIKQKCHNLLLENEKIKLQLEGSHNDSNHRLLQLEEDCSIANEKVTALERQHVEMLEDLRAAEDARDVLRSEAEELAKRYKLLEQEMRKKESIHVVEVESLTQQIQEELGEQEFVIEELQLEIERHSSLNKVLDRDLETEKVKCSSLRSDLEIATRNLDRFSSELNATNHKLDSAEKAVLETSREMVKLVESSDSSVSNLVVHLESKKQENIGNQNRVLELEKALLCLVKVIDDSCEQMSSNNNTEDNDEEKGAEDIKNEVETDGNESNECLESKLKLSLTKIQDIFQAYNDLCVSTVIKDDESKRNLHERDIEISKLKKQLQDSESDLKQTQQNLNSHLDAVEALSNKHKHLQNEKADHHDMIEKLVLDSSDLKNLLSEKVKENENLHLRVMEYSAIIHDYENQIKDRDTDIEQLKEKVTELLFDKDSLWKKLRNESLSESDWVKDDDAKQCFRCKENFSLTLRKHHCRLCGKIFCINCSDNFVNINKKRLRCCNDCFTIRNDDTKQNATLDTSEDFKTPNASDAGFEEIIEENTDEEIVPKPSPSLYQSFSDMVTSTVYSNPSPTKQETKINSVEKVLVAAKKEVQLPVAIEKEGLSLNWEISSDRDINFKLFYLTDESSTPMIVVPTRKLNSHIKPFSGNLKAKKIGIYTIVLDNTYSRFTSKQVTYKLEVVP